MSDNGFGKASIDTQFDGFKYFKLRMPVAAKGESECSLTLRLLPSMKSYRDTGAWKFFYGQHYGYAGVNARDPSRPRSRPFACIQKKNNKTKEIEVHCPKCDQISKMVAKKEARENELAREHGFDEETRKTPAFKDILKADAKHRNLGDWLSKHNCDKKFWINVADKDWNFGVLQLSYKATEGLVKLLKELEAEKIDAFDPNGGLWLKFTRTGTTFNSVTDTVKPLEEIVDVNGRKLKSNVPAPMTQEQIEKALRVCPDLKTEVVKFISAETIQRLVECNGDPEEVDRIWPPEVKKKTEERIVLAGGTKGTETSSGAGALEEGEPDEDPADLETASGTTTGGPTLSQPPPTGGATLQEAAAAQAAATQAATAPAEEDEEAKLERQLAEARARKAAAKTAAAQQMKSPTADITDPDTFINKFSAAK